MEKRYLVVAQLPGAWTTDRGSWYTIPQKRSVRVKYLVPWLEAVWAVV